jgi:hypothetical protein
MSREHLDCDWVPAAPPLAHLLPHRRLQPLQAHGEEGDGGEVCRLLFTFVLIRSICCIRSSSISQLHTLHNRKKTAEPLSIKWQWTRVGYIAKNQHRKSETNIPRKGIAQPQSEFLHSCVCELFMYSQDRSTFFRQQNRQINRGNL